MSNQSNKPSSASFYAKLGLRIKKERINKHISQQRLAESVYLTRTSINNIEHGRQKILLDTFCRISSILEVTPADLLPSLNEINESLGVDVTQDIPEDIKKWIYR